MIRIKEWQEMFNMSDVDEFSTGLRRVDDRNSYEFPVINKEICGMKATIVDEIPMGVVKVSVNFNGMNKYYWLQDWMYETI